jgi:hypothetical protein
MSLNTGLKVAEIKEQIGISVTTSGTLTMDMMDQAILLCTTAQTADRTINFQGNGTNTLDSIMAVGESMTAAALMTQGATAYYLNAYQIDGVAVTPQWQGGSAPTGGNASSTDVYTFTIIKTAAATFTVLASQTQFA